MIIADIMGTPYFEAGDIAYPGGNTLYFGLDSRTDSKKITLFNPSLRSANIELSVINWSEDKFILSWDATTFSKNASTTVFLYPLQSKEITFWVNATHDPWVTSSRIESLKLKASTTLRTENSTEYKEQQINFNLDLDNLPINWINLNTINIEPPEIKINTINSTKRETVRTKWEVEGSDSGISANLGKKYFTKITLINDTETQDILLEKTQEYTITSKGLEYIDFEYNFIYGKYKVKIEVDTTDQVTEFFSSTSSAEFDNINTYSPPIIITDCWLIDNFLHKINFFGDDVIDTEGECNCPGWLTLVIGTGYCANPNSGTCYTFPTHTECNDWQTTSPGLCGWEAETKAITIPGTCQECSNISNSCAGYNNQETCNIDPCNKAEYDCTNLGCDEPKEHKCEWDTTSQQCNFKGAVNNNNCVFSTMIQQQCDENNDEMIISYSSLDSSCIGKTRSLTCGKNATTLNFFSIISLISTIIIIILIHYTKSKKPQKGQNKNKK